MPRRRQVDEPELDNHRPAFRLELVDEDRARRLRRPDREPVPLSALELVWHDEAVWLEPYVARSIELAGGFRPMLEAAGLDPHSDEA
jgi:hypothetical protein